MSWQLGWIRDGVRGRIGGWSEAGRRVSWYDARYSQTQAPQRVRQGFLGLCRSGQWNSDASVSESVHPLKGEDGPAEWLEAVQSGLVLLARPRCVLTVTASDQRPG